MSYPLCGWYVAYWLKCSDANYKWISLYSHTIFSIWRSHGIGRLNNSIHLRYVKSNKFWTDSICIRPNLQWCGYLKRLLDIRSRGRSYEFGTIYTGCWLLDICNGCDSTWCNACIWHNEQIMLNPDQPH